MPDLQAVTPRPQRVDPTLRVTARFPALPKPILQRFGKDAEQWEAELQSWWATLKRSMVDSYDQIATPLNETKEEAKALEKTVKSGDKVLSARIDQEITIRVSETEALAEQITTVEASLNGEIASVQTIATAAATAAGNLAGGYKLIVTAGDVVTGMELLSTSGPGGTSSTITFQTDVLRVISGATTIQLVEITDDAFVFGTDIMSDNYDPGVAGWILTRDGNMEANDAVFRGEIYSTSGQIGGFNIGPAGISASVGDAFIGINAAGVIQLSDTDLLVNYAGTGIVMYNNGITKFSADAATGAVTGSSFGTGSSRRWKTNEQPITGALALVQRLSPKWFNWKETQALDFGFIAEEIAEVLPQVVIRDERGPCAVDYGRLTSILAAAIQELSCRVDSK